jgi:hypothetical protein
MSDTAVGPFSWVRALREGTLTETQLESLQALVDNDEAESLEDAARLLDIQVQHNPGGEPGTRAY